MEIRPDFYDTFACLADRCRHSCCRGWEIDVDGETAAFYDSLDTPLGEALRAAMREEDGVRSFRLTPGGDCPFLRADGLCRVIAELGEDALCDICALHPRFFEDVGEHELCGVSASCEAAAALLLGGKGELTFLTEADEPLTLHALLRRLGFGVPEASLRYAPSTDAARCRAILRRYAACEPIDGDWTRSLAALDAAEDAAGTLEVYIKQYDARAYQRMFEYILYHQLERAEEYGMERLLRFAREAADFIFLWDAQRCDTAEHLRRWSSEIEYSTENAAILLRGE
ncbi:MAG: hypothetical protein E7422_03565 [Ruminococcaceae bacterium]|nr:hypothetical protein [Oscillospiraceae bacterium]